MTDTHLSEVRFSDLPIDARVLEGVNNLGFEYCTPIQAETLPVALNGKDVSGQAQTGTGKTAAFLIATFHRLLNNEPSGAPNNPIRALILAPTRELAIQIESDAVSLAKHTGLRVALAYGGTDYEKQKRKLQSGADVLIGTPGRVIDYFKQKVFSLRNLEVIVLDEADRMFDLGFISDIRFLLRRMPNPEERLNMLFSATLSHRVAELAYEHMNEPTIVKIQSEQVTADRIEEIAFLPSNTQKLPLLLGLLQSMHNPGGPNDQILVFVNTKIAAERIESCLRANDVEVALLSGDVPQRKREKLLQLFKSGEVRVLVATDVAARGLHIPSVRFVINYDLPQDAEDYVHRIGRTARAGATGTAISFVCETYAMNIVDIEEYIGHAIKVSTPIEGYLYSGKIESPKRSKSTSAKAHAAKKKRGAKKKQPQKRADERKPFSERRPFNESKPSSETKSYSDKEPSTDKEPSSDKEPSRERKTSSDAKSSSNTQSEVKVDHHEPTDTAQINEDLPDIPRTKPRLPLRGRSGREQPLIG